jgi:hypothetical protein
MQERVSDFVISFALFVVAAFWVWKHMKTGATTRATVQLQGAEGISASRVPLALFLSRGSGSAERGRQLRRPFGCLLSEFISLPAESVSIV